MKMRILGTNLNLYVPCTKSECRERRPYCLIIRDEDDVIAKVSLNPVVLQPRHTLLSDEIPIVLKIVKHYESWFIEKYNSID